MLAAFNERRSTADVDLLASALANEIDAIAAVVGAVAAIEVVAGVVFETEAIRSRVIRDSGPESHTLSGGESG